MYIHSIYVTKTKNYHSIVQTKKARTKEKHTYITQKTIMELRVVLIRRIKAPPIIRQAHK